MSHHLDVAEIQQRLREFARVRDWEHYHDPKSLAGSVVIEAAELLECFQWLSTEESKDAACDPHLTEQVAAELADVLIYLLRLADVLAIDLAAAVEEKLIRNETRFPRGAQP
ncbi:MAG: nucleotide pyrophosphohydrolase [Acidimicrobiia bacterium]|nr:nucleotide pyrophosphohydrolase [Acidimicrobiia bacterium]